MKRLFKYMLCLLVVGLTMVSCSQDDSLLTYTHTASDKAINFSSSVDKYSTRTGVPTTPDNYLEQIKNFSVWAYFPNDSSYYIGKRDSLGTLIRGDGTGKWYYQKPTDIAYWPLEGSLNFFALTPANSDDYTFTNEGVYYKVPQNNQADVMVATADDQSLNNGNGTVNLNFKHALCQIKFKYTTLNNVELKNDYYPQIEFHNINSIASIPLFSKEIPVKTEYNTYRMDLYPQKGYDAFILPTQKLNGWDGNSSISDANASHKAYIVITGNLYQNDKIIAKRPLYLPVSDITLEAGKCYTFNLVFDGSAKKEDGTSAYTKVDYNVETTDWQYVSNAIVVNETMVDLGLASGTKWARNNVGANKPSDLGDKYAWAETSTKADDEFTFEDYAYHWGTDYGKGENSWNGGMTKYLSSTSLSPDDEEVKDYVDDKKVLDAEDDAATVNWGSNWQTPTKEQWEELIRWCSFESTTLNGKNVLKVTGPNGNYIYMPKGLYMSATLDINDDTGTINQGGDYNILSFIMNMENSKPSWEFDSYRWNGYYVRPVLK